MKRTKSRVSGAEGEAVDERVGVIGLEDPWKSGARDVVVEVGVINDGGGVKKQRELGGTVRSRFARPEVKEKKKWLVRDASGWDEGGCTDAVFQF